MWLAYHQYSKELCIPREVGGLDCRSDATGEGMSSANWSTPIRMPKLQSLEGRPGLEILAPGRVGIGVASFEDDVIVELLWRNYPNNRHIKLSCRSPCFRHKRTRTALRVERFYSAGWVTDIPEAKTSATRPGGRIYEGGSSSCAECEITHADGPRSFQRDQFYWTRLISQHTKAGQGRQALKVYDKMRESRVKPSSYTFVSVLKACCSLKDLESAKQIHAEVARSGFESDVYICTMLVDVYSKCGSLMDARKVFEKMLCRDVVSWNAMIFGYAQREEGEEALQLYAKMQQEGVAPNDRTFVGALKACSSLQACKQMDKSDGMRWKEKWLERVRAIHLDVVEGQFESDLFVGNMLVDVYSKFGNLEDARSVFEKIPCRNVVSWSSMILGYAHMQKGEEALELFVLMQQEGVVPNDRTYIGALKACCSLLALDKGSETDGLVVNKRCLEQVKSIHLCIVKHRFEADIFVGTMLVDVYAKCGSLVDARQIFQAMPQRNVVSWTAMIFGYAQMEEGEEALELYAQMLQEGFVPNERTYLGALKACSSLLGLGKVKETAGILVRKHCLEQVRAIHSQVVTSGCELAESLGTMLVDVYAKCGSLVDARQVFDKMPSHDVVSWNAMIWGYAQMQEGEKSLHLYAEMKQDGVEPDDRTFIGALKACSSLISLEEGNVRIRARLLEQVRAIHAQVVRHGCKSAMFVETMLVDVYAKCGSLVDARAVFDKMPHHDVASWTAMILGYVQVDEGDMALHLYSQMGQQGVVLDAQAFVGGLMACGSVAGLEKGKKIHAQILEAGVDATGPFVASSLIDMYSKCGSMVDAQLLFDALRTRNSVTWSALIAGFARQGDSEAVFNLFEKMKEEGLQVEGVIFLSVLSVCSHVGLVDKGQMYFEAMRREFGITPTIDHYTCMVDLLGRAGQLDKAMAIVRTMPFQPDGAVWRCVLGACQMWRNTELARDAFHCAIRLDKHDAAAYVLMSNIYAAAHMWRDAKEIQTMRVKVEAWKHAGQSHWTDVCGGVHRFAVGDRDHLDSPCIYAELLAMFVRIKEEVLYVPPIESKLPDDEVITYRPCGLSEKLANALAVVKRPT